MKNPTKYERTRTLWVHRKPMLKELSFEAINAGLYEIQEACGDVHWYFDDENGDNLVAAMDGDEDEAYEFKMAFGDIEYKADMLRQAINDADIYDDGNAVSEYFDEFTVGIAGDRYKCSFYDEYDTEDYVTLTEYEARYASEELAERIMRRTKKDMMKIFKQCYWLTIAYYDLKQQYDALKAVMDILRNENISVLQTVKEINETFDAALAEGKYSDAMKRFDSLLGALPERAWIE